MTTEPAVLPEMPESRLRLRRFLTPLPYILLGCSTALALLAPGQTARDRLVTAALATAAAAWALLMYSLRPPAWKRRTGPMLLYAGVQLALVGVLLTRQPIFFVFATIGFVQAYEVLPPRWAFLEVFLTSVLINGLAFGVPDTVAWVTTSATVVALQTFLIGWFGYLGYRFNEQTEQRRIAVTRLRTALAENAGLHAQLVEQAREAGVNDERQRMAREIHDTLAQGLTGIITQLQAAERVRDDPRLWRHHVDQVHTLARESLAAARRSVAALGPRELEEARLPDAVADLAARWSRTSGVGVRVETTGEARTLHTEIEITLFRAAQEALANVAKHARALTAAVTLSYLDDVVMLDVRDDGAGFDPAAVPAGGGADGSGFGLRGVRQRVERVQGTLTIESEPGDGTAVNVTVPALSPEARPA
ncbi:sensor histidine kinase [Dactylosporangium sp. CA-092794]|uniref:sensor histidine kinase n=1 Tax=Dactylosporangium sp. CA-092794 TaxID=3239929 RepID=UPI003D8C9BA2